MKKFLMAITVVMSLLAIAGGVVFADEDSSSINDGRWQKNASSLAVVYQVDATYEVWRYDVSSEVGLKAFEVSYDEVNSAVQDAIAAGENQLVASDGDITFWALTSEECQINSVFPNGETETFIFACPLIQDDDAA
ncbi:MAG: hypothetical protein RLP44_12975 [Aggregatilineales bacterium]